MSRPVVDYQPGDMAKRSKAHTPGAGLPADIHQRAMRYALARAFEREQRRPMRRLSGALGGLWRSVASGGWDS